MNPYYKGVGLVLISAFGFAVMPIFAIFAYREGMNVVTLLFLRFSLAAVLMFAYLIVKGKLTACTRRQLILLFFLGGILYSAQASLYFTAVRFIPASLAALLLYTYPIFVALLASVFDKEKLTRANLLAIILSMAGLVFVLGASSTAVNLAGVLAALGAAVVYSAYLVLGNRVVRELPPVVTTAYVTALAAAVITVGGVSTGTLEFAISAKVCLVVAGIVLFSTVLAVLAMFRGLELIGPTRASILSMVEPLITFAFSALLFADRLTAVQLAGGAAVLAGAVVVVKARAQETGR